MNRIYKTLLDRLFLNPNPQPERPEVLELFNKLSYRMFPGREDYIEFLKTQSIDRQYELVEQIIHRLCYVSNFPPSFFAMKDVLCVEMYQKKAYSESDGFIPRDHFIHLVYIYLLGIYIFFYNNEFYDRILKDNQFQRAVEPVYYPHLNEVKDFISEWRYFSLFHDIGYIPEIFSSKQKVRNPKSAFNHLCKNSHDFHSSLLKAEPLRHESFFGALEIMSRIFVAKFVLENSTKKIGVKNKYFRYFKTSSISEGYKDRKTGKYEVRVIPNFDDEYKSIFDDTYELDKVYSNACLKPILPILNADSIIVLGIHKKKGQLAYISYADKGVRKLVWRDTFAAHDQIEELKKKPQLILYDEYETQDFETVYIINKRKAEKMFYDAVMFKNTDMMGAFNIIEKEMAIKYSSISNEDQFLDFFFEVYFFLYKFLRVYINPGRSPQNKDAADKYKEFLDTWYLDKYRVKCTLKGEFIKDVKWDKDIDSLNSIIYELVQTSYSDRIKKSCVEYIRSINIKLKDIPVTTGDFITPINEMVEDCLKKIASKMSSKKEIEKLKVKIQNEYLNHMSENASMLMIYSIIYTGLKTILAKDVFSFSFDYEKREVYFNSRFCEGFIDKKSPNGTSYKMIIGEYNIPHKNGIDHGFASAQYAAAVFSFLRHSISTNSKNDTEWKLIDILFGISNPEKTNDYIAKYIDNYDHIFENVLYAILMHNVYPDCFNKTCEKLYNMEISISDPFSYLALLTDLLQEWNRPQTLSVSLLDIRPNKHASDYYNIDVNRNGIFIYEEGSEDGQDRLRKKIDEIVHLKDIKAHLINGYVQNDN